MADHSSVGMIARLISRISPVEVASTIVMAAIAAFTLRRSAYTVPVLQEFDGYIGATATNIAILAGCFLAVRGGAILAERSRKSAWRDRLKAARDAKAQRLEADAKLQAERAASAEAERLARRADLYGSLEPAERVVLRVFIDAGLQSVEHDRFEFLLHDLCKTEGVMAAARGGRDRLQHRDFVEYHSTGAFTAHKYFQLNSTAFAELSAHPNWVGSTAPPRQSVK